MLSPAQAEQTAPHRARITPYSAWPKGAEVPEEWIAAAYAKRKEMRLPRYNLRIEAEAFSHHFTENQDRYFADWQRRFVRWCLTCRGVKEDDPTEASEGSAVGDTARETCALRRVYLALKGINVIGFCREDVLVALHRGTITLEQAKNWRRW